MNQTTTLACAACGTEGEVRLRDDAGNSVTVEEYLTALESADLELLCPRCYEVVTSAGRAWQGPDRLC